VTEKRRVLLVEDQMILGFALKGILETMGAEVLGPFARPQEALDVLETHRISGALLDMNLGDGTNSLDVANRLMDDTIPFAFVTGYGSMEISDARFKEVPLFVKPMRREEIAQFVSSLGTLETS